MVKIGSRLELTTRNGPGDWQILKVNGEIDLSSAGSVADRLDQMIDAGHKHLIADLGDVGFMDSTGLSVLARVLKRVRDEGGDLIVICGQGAVRMVLGASGLEHELTVHEEMPSADDL